MASDFTHFDTKMPSDVLGSLMDLDIYRVYGIRYTCNVSFSIRFDSVLFRWSLTMLRGEGVAVSSILRPFAKDMSSSEVPNHKEISTQYHQQLLSIYGQFDQTKP